MSERDYRATPVADRLGLSDVITGLASDLEQLRGGSMSPQQGLAHAAVAKQLFNGVRLYLQALKQLEASAVAAELSDERE